MTRRLLLVIIALLLPITAEAANWAFVNKTEAASPDANSVTSPAIDATTGTYIYFAIGGDGITCTPSDSSGNVYTLRNSKTQNGHVVWAYETQAEISVSSSMTFTANCPGGAPALSVLIFSSSAATTSPVDQSATGGTASGTSLSIGGITPIENNEVVITAITIRGEMPIDVTVPSGFTLGADINGAANNYPIATAYQIQTTATTVNPSWSWTGGNTVAAMVNITSRINTPPVTCTGPVGTVWTAVTWAGVQRCHFLASNGDTISVTAGSYTATSPTVITKYVKIVSNGTVNIVDSVCPTTCASGSSDSLMSITANAAGNTQFGAFVGPCDPSITGCGGFNIQMGTSYHVNPSAVIWVGGNNKPVMVLGNTFGVTGATVSGNFIHIQGKALVAAGNHMVGTPTGANCLNGDSFLRQGSDGSGWTEISKFGNLDTTGDWKIYVENNYMKNVEEALDLNDGTRMVVRFNIMVNSSVVHHGGDTQVYGGRYTEVYSNTFEYDGTNVATCSPPNPINFNGFVGFRGGTSLVLSNVIPTIDPGTWGPKSAVSTAEERPFRGAPSNGSIWRCWGTAMQPSGYTGYPIPYEVGWGYVSGGTQAGNTSVFMDREPAYLANNTGGANYDNVAVFGFPDECGSTQSPTDYVQANREFYQQIALGSFNGTSGASQGTRAQRPASTTNGVAFWSTDQGGNWDTLHGGANDGCLDKVENGTWTNCWYTPLTYPHPNIAAAPNLAFTTQPVNVHTTATMTTFVVTARLADNTTDTGFSGNVVVATSNCTGGSLGGTTTKAAVMGVATFNAVTATGTVTACTIGATASGYTSTVSNGFDIGPNILTFTVQPLSTYVSGTVATVTVATQFSAGGTDSAGTNTITLTGSGCTLGGTTSAAAVSGSKIFTITVSGVGTCSIIASATGLTSATSNIFSVTEAPSPPTSTSNVRGSPARARGMGARKR